MSTTPKFEDTEPVSDQPSFDDTLSVDASPELEDPQMKDVSKTESLLRGAAQGASLGFADEVTGGLEAISDADLANFVENYRKHRDESRDNYKSAQEANPTTYLAGELGSALIPTGVGAIGAVGKGASLAQKVYSGLKGGAVVGGLAGLGTSNTDVTKGEMTSDKVMDEVITPAAWGAAGGAGLSYAGNKLAEKFPGMINSVKNSRLGKQMGRSFELGAEGKAATGEEAAIRTAKQINDSATKIQKALFKNLDDNFNKKMEIFAANPDKKVDLEALRQHAMNMIDNAVADASLSDPAVAQQLRDAVNAKLQKQQEKLIKNVTKNIKETTFDKFGDVVGDKSRVTEQLVDDVGELIPGKMSEGKVTTRPSGLTKESTTVAQDLLVPAEARGLSSLEEAANIARSYQNSAYTSKMSDPVKSGILKRLSGKASDVIEEAVPEIAPLNKTSTNTFDVMEKLGIDAADKGNFVPAVSKKIENIEKRFDPANRQKNKEVFNGLRKALGSDAANPLIKEARQAAMDFDIAKTAGKENSLGIWDRLTGGVKGKAFWASNAAGKASQNSGVKTTGNVVSKLSEAVSSLPRKSYEAMASGLDRIGKPEVAQKFRDAAGADTMKRNALLFTILQNPNEREAVESVMDEEN